MTPLKLIDKSLFGHTRDMWAFSTYLPIFILYGLVFYVLHLDLPHTPSPMFLFVTMMLIDESHVYSTFFVSYADRRMTKVMKAIFWATPLLILATAFSFGMFAKLTVFYSIFAYVAIFHFVRQNFGWMKLASLFEFSPSSWQHRLDLVTMYVMCLAPFLWFSRESVAHFWFRPGDLIQVPQALATIAVSIYWPVVTVNLAINLWHWKTTKRINLTKLLILLNTFFGWYVSQVLVENSYLGIWLMVFHHGVPYLFMVFSKEKFTASLKLPDIIQRHRFLFLYLMCVGGYYVFKMTNLAAADALKTDLILSSLIYAIGITPTMTHFILDGFIWKRRYPLTAKS